MRIGLFVLNLCFLLLINCSGDKTTTEIFETDNQNQEFSITQKTIENFDYADYGLSSEAEADVADWEKYQELAIQINYLKKADLSFFNGDKLLLNKFLGEFRATTPKKFLNNPIISRTIVIETTILKLNENLTLDNIEGQIKLESVKEVLVAFSNLNYQINKKLERDYYDKIKSEY